ncbi:heavy-metal-associated domain-containing protein [Brumimicrobium glaciale]|uniref:Heavy-metal-associated domain-containing protein n=1 Tax=Brumimicrobium glaciale TaxID=200475 RepID=A0A4Q4KPQ6_9FLAO|nr:heavy metal-associated domain-containing protein [Brumimicrobium glaciale]RYM35098.1 heavy-metal-associated domain-containing protein [Brumimicrobium glaciale]
MRRTIFLIMLLSFLLGCESKEAAQQEVVSKEDIAPTHMATFEVEGMMCQKGCGAAIRKSLYETGGVSKVEVAFAEENPASEIKVYFDIKKTSTEKMIVVIGNMAESRYSARLKKVTESTISPMKVFNDDKSSNNKLKNISTREVSNEVATERFTFPNLTKLLNGLIN